MIEINLNKLIGTGEGNVQVTRDGTTFWRRQRVGKKDVPDVSGSVTMTNDDKYDVNTDQVKAWIDDNPDRAADVANTYTYCKAGYEIINKTMRGIPDDVFDKFLPPEDLQSISNFLHDAPKFNGTVYRGVTINDKDEFNDFMVGVRKGKIRMKPFTSTTTDQKLSKGFAYLHPRINPPIYMEIKSKRGVAVSKISHFSSENEVLFDYGSRFKVTDFKVTDSEVNIKLEEI